MNVLKHILACRSTINIFTASNKLFCNHSAANEGLFTSLIKTNTVISRNHLTPELSLHLITPECKLWFDKHENSPFLNDPFWAIYWPGGQALARFILDNRDMFQGKSVLDVGSGSGACAIAAVKCDARLVIANDIDPMCAVAIDLNSKLNDTLGVIFEGQDLIGSNVFSSSSKQEFLVTDFNVVLIGDMFYDKDFAVSLFKWLCELCDAGSRVFVGDPGRYALKGVQEIKTTHFLEKVVEYELNDLQHYGFSTASVWEIKK